MLEHDLRDYRCPQQFIQFKLGLRKAATLNKRISFYINTTDTMTDIERFLKKQCYYYKFDKQRGLLTVEPLRV
jgi:TusA-related sulfurtransferase